MDMTKQWLRAYGLNDKEAELFVLIAKNPYIKVTELQRLTGYIRTSLYYSLNQLVARGLVSENIENNIRTFTIQNRDIFRHHIEHSIHEKQALLKQLPAVEAELKTYIDTQKEHSTVVRYEGEKSIKTALEDAFRCRSKQWHIIAAKDNFLSHMSDEYKQYYLEQRDTRGIKAKTLWEPLDRVQGLKLKDIIFRAPRQLPEDFLGTFHSLVIMYDDTILVVDDHKSMSAYAIKNRATTELFILFFMSLWRAAKPIV